jgi:predicted Ser/Thr protein kinase
VKDRNLVEKMIVRMQDENKRKSIYGPSLLLAHTLTFRQMYRMFPRLNKDSKHKLQLMTNAKILSTPGRGILATDENETTCDERFKELGIENTKESRCKYRELLYTTP